MGAFNRRNKQADLAKKMQAAKEQRRLQEQGPDSDLSQEDSLPTKSNSSYKGMTAEEIRQMNDRKRFEDLLNSDAGALAAMDEFGEEGGAYMTRAQEEEEYMAPMSMDKLYEGDPCPITPFENLVHFNSLFLSNNNAVPKGTPLGKRGTTRLLPWLSNTKPTEVDKDYLVIISDPRPKSIELKQTLKNLEVGLKSKKKDEIWRKLIVINADSPNDNKKFTKKNQLDSMSIYSDESREWMREYSALGSKRWSMSMFVIADGVVQKLVRDLDEDLALSAVINAVRSLGK